MSFEKTGHHSQDIHRQHDDWDEVHNQLLAIQKKSLEVSDPNDADEKEADEVAKKVTGGESAEIHGTSGTINRKGEGAVETTSGFQTQLASNKGNGQSLPNQVQQEMGSKMGADLSNVKIHTGDEANAMNESVNAKAFTHGQDVFFKQGEFNTGSAQGKELLAHELVHTVQQGSGKTNASIQRVDNPVEEITTEIPEDAVALEVVDFTDRVLKAYNEPVGNDFVVLLDDTTPPGTYMLRFTFKDGTKTYQKIVKNPDTQLKITVRNTALPTLEGEFRDPRINNLSDILTYYPAGSSGVKDYQVMQTTEFANFTKPEFHLTYEEALRATRAQLADMYKQRDETDGKKKHIKSGTAYASDAVTKSSYEEGMFSLQELTLDGEFNRDIADNRNHNKIIWQRVSNIKAELDSKTEFNVLNLFVQEKSAQLWNDAKGSTDDRALYWARVKMKRDLRQHKLLKGNPALLQQVFATINEYSRGRADIKFEKTNASGEGKLKKILVSGFEPFQGGKTNPSGIVAQMFDGQLLQIGDEDVGEVEAAIFPNSYTQFDEGVVESFYDPYINDPEKQVYMIMTISLDSGANEMQVERYAANTRAGWDDNEGVEKGMPGWPTYPEIPSGTYAPIDIQNYVNGINTNLMTYMPGIEYPKPPIGKPLSWYTAEHVNPYLKQFNAWYFYNRGSKMANGKAPDMNNPAFIETNFPIKELLNDTEVPNDMRVDQSYSYYSSPTNPNVSNPDTYETPTMVTPGAGNESELNTPPPEGVKAIEGSGGDYFSNEIYYRVSLLRANSKNSTVKNVHLHIPEVGKGIKPGSGGDTYDIDDIYWSAKGILERALKIQMEQDASKSE
jgi:pyrrolidone-carboxylate peptidase